MTERLPIVERLREKKTTRRHKYPDIDDGFTPLKVILEQVKDEDCRRAAELIEKLVEALEPFAEQADSSPWIITPGMMRNARAALELARKA